VRFGTPFLSSPEIPFWIYGPDLGLISDWSRLLRAYLENPADPRNAYRTSGSGCPNIVVGTIIEGDRRSRVGDMVHFEQLAPFSCLTLRIEGIASDAEETLIV